MLLWGRSAEEELGEVIEAYARLGQGSELRRKVPNLHGEFGTTEVPNLIIAGKDGWMSEEIYQAPEKYGVKDRVKFIGRVDDEDLPAVYKQAFVFVWPSLMEGFGLPILEAMQMGVPVVCSNRGALPEVAGEAAIQVDPEKIDKLVEAMRLILESRKLREGMIKKGLRQVTKFSYKQAAQETLRVLTDWD